MLCTKPKMLIFPLKFSSVDLLREIFNCYIDQSISNFSPSEEIIRTPPEYSWVFLLSIAITSRDWSDLSQDFGLFLESFTVDVVNIPYKIITMNIQWIIQSISSYVLLTVLHNRNMRCEMCDVCWLMSGQFMNNY